MEKYQMHSPGGEIGNGFYSVINQKKAVMTQLLA
jgi:hypothetical protein